MFHNEFEYALMVQERMDKVNRDCARWHDPDPTPGDGFGRRLRRAIGRRMVAIGTLLLTAL